MIDLATVALVTYPVLLAVLGVLIRGWFNHVTRAINELRHEVHTQNGRLTRIEDYREAHDKQDDLWHVEETDAQRELSARLRMIDERVQAIQSRG